MEQARFAGHHVLFGTVVVEAVSGEPRGCPLREHGRGLPKEDDVVVGVRLGSVVGIECGVEWCKYVAVIERERRPRVV